ncbi:hypothetical protein [Microbacterium murale]|uniref:hypothetical protein n=1 Tax=Microbacterium murale TaxID=1081040 RepID=UPI00166EA081|nr:hypothetical protein [Microbacterium murale]
MSALIPRLDEVPLFVIEVGDGFDAGGREVILDVSALRVEEERVSTAVQHSRSSFLGSFEEMIDPRSIRDVGERLGSQRLEVCRHLPIRNLADPIEFRITNAWRDLVHSR